MITGLEIRAALEGSWHLLRNRPQGMAYFDQSIQGFWRSFQVIFLLLPLAVISSAAERRLILTESDALERGFSDGSFWTSMALGLGIDWIALPVILAALAGPLGVSSRYVPFVVARNWTSLLTAVPYVAIALLYLMGLIAAGTMVFLSLICLVAVLWYRFLVTRISLQAGVGLAIGIVVLDVVVSLLINELVSRLWAV